jgi:hypothetical protein
MGLDSLLARLAGTSVTPATSDNVSDVAPEAAPTLAVTSVTSVTAPRVELAGEAFSHRWLLHYADAEPLLIAFVPAATQRQVLGQYPGALAAEPMADADSALSPGEGAAFEQVSAMNNDRRRCCNCAHFKRPGLSAGYCTCRDDLPHAYGFLHRLPLDQGAQCEHFKEMTG